MESSHVFRHSRFTLRMCFVGALVAALGPAAALWGTDYNISDTNDGFVANGSCTLREALYAAHANTGYDSCPAGSTGLDRIFLTNEGGTYFFDDGLHVISPGDGPLLIEGPTSDSADATITMQFQNRFIHMNSGSDPLTMRNLSVILGKQTTGSGGALNVLDSSLTLENVAIGFCNSDTTGGAITFEADRSAADSLVIRRSNISGNSVGGTWPRGGAVYASVSGTGEVRIEDSQFLQNVLTATLTQGGSGGALNIYAADQAKVVISRCEFTDNSITIDSDIPNDGAGLYLRVNGNANAKLTDSWFTDNLVAVPAATTAPQVGGAALHSEGNGILVADRLVFDGNVAANVAGSAANPQVEVKAYDDSSSTFADALVVNGRLGLKTISYQTSDVVMSFLTAADNEFGISLSLNNTSTMALYNSIAWNNLYIDLNSDLGVTEADNLIGVEPHFVNPGAGDYTLQAISPAVGAADVSHPGSNTPFDLSHAPRVVGSDPDQGAYERGGLFADDFESGDTTRWSVTFEYQQVTNRSSFPLHHRTTAARDPANLLE